MKDSDPQLYVPPGKGADDNDLYFSQMYEGEQKVLLISLYMESYDFVDEMPVGTMIKDAVRAGFSPMVRTTLPLVVAFYLFTPHGHDVGFLPFMFLSILGCFIALFGSRLLELRASTHIQRLVMIGHAQSSGGKLWIPVADAQTEGRSS